MSFSIVNQSIFDTPADALVNCINVCGIMGTGVALEFKKRYPLMFEDYQLRCKNRQINPGDCYVYFDVEHHVWILGLAVKNDWQHWATREWIEQSLKSMKLVILENDIKSVNMPLPGGRNGRRGPFGKIPNMTPPPDPEELKQIVQNTLIPFANKFDVDIKLCIPQESVKKPFTLDELFSNI